VKVSTEVVANDAGPRDPIWALQYLRGFAALIVVFFHSGVYQALLRKSDINTLNIGAIGVDIFFVLSGFIIMYVTEHKETPLRFITKRALRILPTLWACVTIWLFRVRSSSGPPNTMSPHCFYGALSSTASLWTRLSELPGL
jgi:peptidoglycan/LPS O-acetylase OafA/YrhL